MKTKNGLTTGLMIGMAVLFFSCNKPAPTEAGAEVEAVAPSTDRINMMIKDWERAKKFTQAYLDSANDKSIAFKASPTVRTFGQQLLHLAEANYGIAQAATGKATEMGFGKLEKDEKFKTKADVAKAVMDSYDYVIAGLKEMNDDMLKDNCSLFDMTMTKELALNKAFEHQTHHRGQTTQYLRGQGKTPPQEMLF
jgi:uncharacterized damage-inducible protein DinB